MFKKKNELPPWPKPPTNDQMLEDIYSAAADDPVFTEFISQKMENSEKGNVDTTYDQVKSFLTVTKEIEKTVAKLSEQNDALLTTQIELRKMTDDIRQKAVEALK